jgi:hypothetical protein
MSGKLTRRGFVVLAGGLLLGGALAGTAVAQQATDAPWGPGACPMGFGSGPRAGQGPGAGGGPGFGPGGGRGPGAGPAAGLQDTTHGAIAATLGLSAEELFTALRSGKTIAQLAQEKGVDLETVVTAALEAHDKALDAQVQAGRISQEQADLMDSRMEARIRAMVAGQYGPGSGGGPGFGPGMGPGMHPGRRGPGMGPGFGPGWRGQQ